MSYAATMNEERNHRGAQGGGFLGDNLMPSIKNGFNAVSDAIPQNSKFMAYAAFGLASLTGAIVVPKLLDMTQLGGFSRFTLGSIAIVAIAAIGGGTLATMFKGNDFGEALEKTMNDIGGLFGMDDEPRSSNPEPNSNTPVASVEDNANEDKTAFGPTEGGGFQTADITAYSSEDGITVPADGKIVAIQHKSDLNTGASGQNPTSSFVIDHGNGVYSRYQAEIDRSLLGSTLSANDTIEASVDVANVNALGEGVVARQLLIQENSASQTYYVDPNGYDIDALVNDKAMQQEAVGSAKELASEVSGGNAQIISSYQAPLASQHVQEFNTGSGVLPPKEENPVIDRTIPEIKLDALQS